MWYTNFKRKYYYFCLKHIEIILKIEADQFILDDYGVEFILLSTLWHAFEYLKSIFQYM